MPQSCECHGFPNAEPTLFEKTIVAPEDFLPADLEVLNTQP